MSPRVSHLDNEQCRQCTSFADYMKQSKDKMKNEQKNQGEQGKGEIQYDENGRRKDCPLDKDELGRNAWSILHTIAAKYPEQPTDDDKNTMNTFIHSFSKLYPCEPCAKDFQADLVTNPPKLDCQARLSHWLCELHNRVNVKIGKPVFDCKKVNERWRDGWLDGSCD